MSSVEDKASWSHYRNLAGVAVLIVTLAVLSLAGPAHNYMMHNGQAAEMAKWESFLRNKFNAIESPGTADRTLGALGVALNTGVAEKVELVNSTCACRIEIETFDPLTPPAEKSEVAQKLRAVVEGTLPQGTHVHLEAPHHAAHVQGTDRKSRSGMHHGHDHTALSAFSYEVNGQRLTFKLVRDITGTSQTHMAMIAMMGFLIVTLCSLAIFAAAKIAYQSRMAEELSLEQARYLAEHDTLTNLYNRFGFSKRASALLRDCIQDDRRVCLIQFDADNFKQINDMHGHDAGDKVLIAIAEMIDASFPQSAVKARLGGDEFAVLVAEDAIGDETELFLGTVPTEVDTVEAAQSLAVSTSAGFAFYPEDGTTIEELSKAADLALYAVKGSHKTSIGGYHRDMSEALERRIWEIEGVREAIESNRIVPFYQPLVNARTMEVEGLEALVRWDHPEKGILSPGHFESALNDAPTAQLITKAMLDGMTADLSDWWRDGYAISAGLNLGEADLQNPELSQMILDKLEDRELPVAALAVEVTETAVGSHNYEEVLPCLERLRSKGMFIGLDDFGTGASSITLLRSLPCTALKIDKSFVTEMANDADDHAVVGALTTLAHDLGLKVVAEGVETESQRQLLNAIGVDLLQGYLVSKPLAGGEVPALLKKLGAAPRRNNSKDQRFSA